MNTLNQNVASSILIGLLYLDVGIAFHSNKDDIYVIEDWNIIKWRNPLLSVEAGYKLHKTTIFIKHTSSAQNDDVGLNEIGIDYRLYEW